jgi:hypothetical protein
MVRLLFMERLKIRGLNRELAELGLDFLYAQARKKLIRC